MAFGKWSLVAIGLVFAHPCAAQDDSTKPFQDPNPQALQPGANSFAEGQARSLIEAKGFSRVSALVNDSSGIWRGKAVRDNREVDVSVDYRGHVVTQ